MERDLQVGEYEAGGIWAFALSLPSSATVGDEGWRQVDRTDRRMSFKVPLSLKGHPTVVGWWREWNTE